MLTGSGIEGGPQINIAERASGASQMGPTDWIERAKVWARPYYPRLRNRRFWIGQGLITVVAGLHVLAESLRLSGYLPVSDYSISFVAIALLYIPVIYVALNFGFAGSVATTSLCIILTIPDAMLFHSGLVRATVLFQLGTFAALAIFIGQWVDREQRARRRAEAAISACGASEMKYRGLFESSPVAILVADSDGAILEANPAAGVLFGRPASGLKNMAIADLVGINGERLCDTSQDEEKGREDHLVLGGADGSQVHLEPTFTRIGDGQGKLVVQVLLRDVTHERQRQAGLRAYAAKIVRLQEEERRRLAQELHDEIVQQLILLCRKLDLIEGSGESFSPRIIDELGVARSSAEEVIKWLREFASNLRPPALDDLGLVTCIRRVLVDFAERAKINGQMTVVGDERRLPPDVELGLFRIAQEATRNVERHARASNVNVALVFGARQVELEVIDDGIGFRLPLAADFAARGQLGLLGMRERAESLSGSLEIRSSQGDGTRVVVSIPIGQEPRRR